MITTFKEAQFSVIGILLSPVSDGFSYYSIGHTFTKTPTKRQILTVITKIYAETGF